MTKTKHEALITLQGGPCDGRTLAIDSHETLTTLVDDVPYERTDQQLGDHRVYRYAPEASSAPGVELRGGSDGENLLHRDLAELEPPAKAKK